MALPGIRSISVLGSEQAPEWAMTDNGLQIGKIDDPPFDSAVVLKISMQTRGSRRRLEG